FYRDRSCRAHFYENVPAGSEFMARQIDAPSGSPVLIVGGGPTGLTLAILLARRGIRSVVVERDPRPQEHPAACIINTRTMEVFREAGIEADVRLSSQD